MGGLGCCFLSNGILEINRDIGFFDDFDQTILKNRGIKLGSSLLGIMGIIPGILMNFLGTTLDMKSCKYEMNNQTSTLNPMSCKYTSCKYEMHLNKIALQIQKK